jgi:hypothetical protein
MVAITSLQHHHGNLAFDYGRCTTSRVPQNQRLYKLQCMTCALVGCAVDSCCSMLPRAIKFCVHLPAACLSVALIACI